MKFKLIVCSVIVLLIVGLTVFGFEVWKILQYEKRGLETRTVCMSLVRFVENEKRWPSSWDELSLPAEKLDVYKSSVDIRFDLTLSEASELFMNGQPVVKPKFRSLPSFESAVQELERVVIEAVQEQDNDAEIETAD